MSAALSNQHAKRMRHLRPVLLYHIFTHYLIIYIITEKLLNTKRVFWFSLQLRTEKKTCPKKNAARDDQKCILVFKQSVRHSCQIVMKPEFPRQIFKNNKTSYFMKLRPMKTIAVCSQTHTNTLGGLQRVWIDKGTQLWRISVCYLTPPVGLSLI